MLRKPSGSVISHAGGFDSDGDNDLLPSSKPLSTKSNSEKTSGTSQSAGSTVQKAFEATGFKSVNGEYQIQGRLGIALLAGVHKPDFKLLVYASGNVVVTQAVVTAAFQLSITGLYVSFYDAFNQNWSFLFDSEDKVEDFVRFITIAQFRSDNCAHLVSTDWISGTGDKLSTGDSAEIRYTGWILQANGTLGTLFETTKSPTAKSFRFKIGKGKSIKVWDEGLIGMQRGSHRIIVAPSNKAYGSKGHSPKVPGGANVVFNVEVLRVKVLSSRASDSPSLPEMLSSKPPDSKSRGNSVVVDDTPLPLLPADEDSESEQSVKERTRSISEKLEGKHTKQSILSRMSKMGQAMLPRETSATTQESDFDDSESQSNIPVISHTEPVKTTSHIVVQPIPSGPQETSIHQKITPGFQTYVSTSNHGYQMDPYYMQASAQPSHQLMAYSSNRQGVPIENLQMNNPTSMYQQPIQVGPPTANPTSMYQQPIQVGQPAANSNNAEHIHTAMLVNETRQQNTEVRLSIAKLQDKMDTVIGKVDQQMNKETRIVPSTPTVPTMENTVLLQNLTRIIQENEHLKEEIFHKSEKIEKQNKKITELLAKNETYLEENNQSIERNAESFKVSATHSQAKVLELEEQKLRLMQDLSKRTSELYDLQITSDEQKKLVSDQNRKLASNAVKCETLQREINDLQVANGDLHESIADVKARTKEDKESFRSMERKLQDFDEREQELKLSMDLKEKTSKQKLSRIEEEKQKVTQELEQMKCDKEKEIEELREKLRHERASGYSDTSLIQNQIEKEVTERWKKRCDQLVKAEGERFERKLIEVEEDNSKLQGENAALISKIQLLKDQTREMKRTLQEEINRLNTEVETAAEDVRTAKHNPSISSNKETTNTAAIEDVSTKVRAVMNIVYRSIREKIVADSQYDGTQIHQIVMEVIREKTLELIAQKTEESENESEDESEEDSDEVSEDEEIQSNNESEEAHSTTRNGLVSSQPEETLSLNRSNNLPITDLVCEKEQEIANESSFNIMESAATEQSLSRMGPPVAPDLVCVVHPVTESTTKEEKYCSDMESSITEINLPPPLNQPESSESMEEFHPVHATTEATTKEENNSSDSESSITKINMPPPLNQAESSESKSPMEEDNAGHVTREATKEDENVTFDEDCSDKLSFIPDTPPPLNQQESSDTIDNALKSKPDNKPLFSDDED